MCINEVWEYICIYMKYNIGIFVRPDCNKTFYKKKVSCMDILSGNIEIPNNDDYNMLTHLLDTYCEENDLSPGIDQQKLTLDNVNNVDNDEQKDKENNESVGQKISQGFSSLKKSVSKKFNDLGKKNNQNEINNNNDKDGNSIQDQFDQ